MFNITLLKIDVPQNKDDDYVDMSKIRCKTVKSVTPEGKI